VNSVVIERASFLRERSIGILPGQYFDAETGLHQNWHRDYDPSIGRYLQPDPLGLEAGLNQYLYANANPLTYFDPTGLDTVRTGLTDYFKCRRLQKELEAAWKKCEQSKECQPPPPTGDSGRDLEALGRFTHWTYDPDEPIRRCVQRDNPGLLSETALTCGEAVMPGLKSVVPRRRPSAF
jgi:RHS repeat-associated protein